MPVPLGSVGRTNAIRIDFHSVTVTTLKAGPPLIADHPAILEPFREQIDRLEGMCVTHAADHKRPADKPHDHQQDGSNDRKSENSTQHNLARPNWLGRDGLNRLRLDIGRQAENREHQHNETDQ